MKRIIVFLLAFTLSFSFSTSIPAHAQEQQQNVVMAKDTVTNEDYFATGDNINILGTINGDAYVAGGNVTFDGTVNGDIIAAGGNVTIRGTAQNVRVTGGQVLIDGTVEKNITALGGNVTLGDRAVLKGSVTVAGGSIRLSAPVAKGARLAGGNVTVDNTINGNLIAATGQLTLLPQAKINGNLDYLSDQKAQIMSGASVSGKVTHNMPEQQKKDAGTDALLGVGAAFLFFKIIDTVSLLVLGLLIIFLAPRYLQRVADTITARPWASLGLGFLILILGPIIFFILLMTIIGIPIAFIFLALYLPIIYLAKIFAIYFIGEKVAGSLNARMHMALAFILGLFIFIVVNFIPILGGLVEFVALLLGAGSLLMNKSRVYNVLRKQKEL